MVGQGKGAPVDEGPAICKVLGRGGWETYSQPPGSSQSEGVRGMQCGSECLHRAMPGGGG